MIGLFLRIKIKFGPNLAGPDFNATEVILAIRKFVTNFFGCKECAENFAKETNDFANRLIKPQDPVIYLWTG